MNMNLQKKENDGLKVKYMSKVTHVEIKDGKLEEVSNMEINFNSLPSSDKLAFGYGLARGQHYLKVNKGKNSWQKEPMKHGSNHRELAPEYLRGFLLGYKGILVPEGTKIKKGEEQSLYHFDKNILKG